MTQATTNENQDRGVEYNIKIIKRKQKDNIIEMTPQVLSSRAESPSNTFVSSEEGHCEDEVQEDHYATAYSTPLTNVITQDNVKRCMIQLFKNDDKRYKLKVRLNLIYPEGEENADFIATLGTDRRNFKQYLPAGCEDWFVEWSDTQYNAIKKQIGVKPYRGKFHSAQAFKPGRKVMTQIEPWCQCVVWYDPEKKSWFSIIHLYEFSIVSELKDDGLTIAQKRNNLHKQDLWINPKHDTRIRPQTWAQMRGKV